MGGGWIFGNGRFRGSSRRVVLCIGIGGNIGTVSVLVGTNKNIGFVLPGESWRLDVNHPRGLPWLFTSPPSLPKKSLMLVNRWQIDVK